MPLNKIREPNRWSSGANPIIFGFDSDIVPVVTAAGMGGSNPITAIVDDNGYAQIQATGTVFVSTGGYLRANNSLYSGIFKVIRQSTTNYTIDTPYIGNSSGGTIEPYFNNYSGLLNLFVETVEGSGIYKKVFSYSQRMNPDSQFIFDLMGVLGKMVSHENFGYASLIRKASNSFRRYYVAYSEQYEQVQVDGVYRMEVQDFTTDEIDGCAPDSLIDGSFTTDDGSWNNSGEGETWEITEGKAKMIFGTETESQYWSKTIALTAGKYYCITFTYAASLCDTENTKLYVFLTGVDPTDISQQRNLAIITEPGTYTFCFTAEDQVNLSFKVTSEVPCEGDYTTLDNVVLYDNLGCANLRFVNNSVEQYLQQPGSTYKLERYVMNGNPDKQFLTLYPRNHRKKVKADDLEYLGIISGGLLDATLEYEYFSKTGASLGTDSEAIDIEEEARYDLMIMPTLPVGTDYFTVKIVNGLVSPVESETFTYEIDEKCHKYAYRLHWLNSLGATDSFTFAGKASYNSDTIREGEVKRNLLPDNFQPQFPQYETLSVIAKEGMVISSGFVKREVFDWLYGVVRSKQVRLEMEIEGERVQVPVRVKGNPSRYMDGDKKIKLEMEIVFAFDILSQ